MKRIKAKKVSTFFINTKGKKKIKEKAKKVVDMIFLGLSTRYM